MGRRVVIKPLQTLNFDIVDTDGNIKTIDFTFNNYAVTVLTEEFGDLNNVLSEFDSKPYDTVAILLYCGVKPNNVDFTLEEARSIIASGGREVLEEISAVAIDSILIASGDEGKKLFKMEIERQMKKLQKK